MRPAEMNTGLRGLKLPDLRPYDPIRGEWVDVQAIGIGFQRSRHGSAARWLHEMRSDLGRLDATVEILQVGPVLSRVD
jgi:hypothetical protein